MNKPDVQSHARQWCIAFMLIFAFPAGVVGDMIPSLYHTVSLQKHVPVRVLYGVAMQESKKAWSKGEPGKPWPWTLNINHKPYYFKTYHDALAKLRATLSTGETRIAVGLMQVRWDFHAQRFNHDPTVILDPLRNIQIGADILSDFRRKTRHDDWLTAIAFYHAGAREGHPAGIEYQQLVIKRILQQNKREATL